MKITINEVEINLPATAKLCIEDPIESVEMDLDDAQEVLLAAVRKVATKINPESTEYGRFWKLIDPDGELGKFCGPGWVKEIVERLVKSEANK